MRHFVLLVLVVFLPLAFGQSVSCTCTAASSWATKFHYEAHPNGMETWLGVYSSLSPWSQCPSNSETAYTTFISSYGSHSTVSADLSPLTFGRSYTCVLWKGPNGDCMSRIASQSFSCPDKPSSSPIPPSTRPSSSNAGLYLAIFLPIGIVALIIFLVVLIICVRRAQQKRLAAYSAVSTTGPTTATNPLQYAPMPGQPGGPGAATMTFVPAHMGMHMTSTGVQPPTYMMSAPGAGTMQPMMYMPQNDPTMSAQPVFIATATNPGRQ